MKYNINDENIVKLLTNIQNQIKEQKGIIEQLQKIDNKYCKIKIDFNQLEGLLNKFKTEKIETPKKQKLLITYNGDPYITLNLSIISIITQSIVTLDYNEHMIGVNSLIIDIINDCLNNYETDKLIYSYNKTEEIKNIEKIICIDDINKYNSYLKEKNKRVKFYSLNYLDFYCDSDEDEFEEIKQLIYQFCENNKISIEAYSELDIHQAIPMIKNGLGNTVVVLTNNKQTKSYFEKSIKNKKLYINKNPFDKDKRIINKDFILI